MLYPPCTMLEIDFDPETDGVQKQTGLDIKAEMKK